MGDRGAGRAFLLEIGCEEIPAPMIRRAMDDLAAGLLTALGSLAEGATAWKDLGGPRRLVARLTGVRDREDDREETVLGPARGIAFDAAGAPTKAGAGFARAQGVDPASLRVVAGSKGEVVAVVKRVRGRSAAEVLAEACPRVLGALRFGKMMRWGDRGFVFVRPVHWILALLDDAVVPFAFMGIESGRRTHGHRFLGPGPHVVSAASEYETVLRESGRVIASIEERRRRLLDLAAREAAAAGATVRPDDELVEELIFLTEHPAVVRGSFPESFLALPEPVLMTTMRHHQKYLTLAGPDGRLRNGFVAVLTTEPDADGRIRRGNEWVLKARLADAEFFFHEDRKVPLEGRVKDLARITVHARLGTYGRKVARMAWVLEDVAGILGAAGIESAADRRDLETALRLGKADLTTGMVGEFPELQGIVGGLYARLDGHSEGVARAIEEHYLPTSATGPIPARGPACLVALADKLDTLALCFAAGLVPRGSADPYGLRRAAMGVLRILIENGIPTDLAALYDRALEAGAPDVPPPGGAERKGGKGAPAAAFDPRGALHEFTRQRLQFLMEEAGIRFDAARAVLAVDWTDPLRAWRRAQALNRLRGQDDFLALAAAAKRVRNILAQAAAKGIRVEARPPDPARLGDGAEAALHAAMGGAAREAGALATAGDHAGALRAIAALRPAADRFFDEVLVMDPDEAVRLNRLSLLAELARLLSREADFAEIMVEGDSPARGPAGP